MYCKSTIYITARFTPVINHHRHATDQQLCFVANVPSLTTITVPTNPATICLQLFVCCLCSTRSSTVVFRFAFRFIFHFLTDPNIHMQSRARCRWPLNQNYHTFSDPSIRPHDAQVKSLPQPKPPCSPSNVTRQT